MKKLLTIFLILSLLLQFMACSSTREMSLEELENYQGQNNIVLMTSQEEVVINRKSRDGRTMNWEASDSLITIRINEPILSQNYKKLKRQELDKAVNNEIKIKYNEIESIEIDEFSITKTAILLVPIITVIALEIAHFGAPTGPIFEHAKR